MVLNTECEATAYYGVRQPDTDRYRYWEVAGASHVSLQAMASSAPRLERDFGFSIPLDDESMQAINRVSVAPVVDAALHHLQTWVSEDTVPPVQPRIDFDGAPPQIVRDADGIAEGGIRLPQVAVPLAHNSALQRTPDIFARLVGSHDAFSVEKIRQRYGTRDAYLEQFEAAARGRSRVRGPPPPTSTPSWRKRPRGCRRESTTYSSRHSAVYRDATVAKTMRTRPPMPVLPDRTPAHPQVSCDRSLFASRQRRDLELQRGLQQRLGELETRVRGWDRQLGSLRGR